MLANNLNNKMKKIYKYFKKINNKLKIDYLIFKVVKYIVYFTPKKIKKKLNLYELREICYFFFEIIVREGLIKKKSFFLFRKLSLIFFKILNFINFGSSRKRKIIGTKKKSIFLDKLNFLEKEIFFYGSFRLNVIFLKILFRNFIINYRKLILNVCYSFPFLPSFLILEFGHFKGYSLKKYFLFFFDFSRLVKLNDQKNFWDNLGPIIKKENLVNFFNRKISSLEEFFSISCISSITTKLILSNRNDFYHFTNLLRKTKFQKKKLFKPKNFLCKIKNYKNLKKILLENKFYLFFKKKKDCFLFYFKSFKNQFFFQPKFREHKAFLEIFQKNINLLFELDKWKKDFSSFILSKPFLNILKSLKNVNFYCLFLFKILHFIYIFKFKILKNLTTAERFLKKFNSINKISFIKIKEGIFRLFNTFNYENHFDKKDENFQFTTLKLIRFIFNSIKIINKKTKHKAYSSKKKLIKLKTKEIKKQKKTFLEKIDDSQKIFESRFSCFLYCLMDLKTENNETKFFEFNEFFFRKTGF
jgi:hypothetical protein